MTPAVWIISDVHLDLWIAHGWNPQAPDLSSVYDPRRENVYLILGDVLNGLHNGNQIAREMIFNIFWELSTRGKVYYVLGNHEFYRGIFSRTQSKFASQFCSVAIVIDKPITFVVGDTAFLLATNWPAMSSIDYLMHTTDLAGFMHEGPSRVSESDMETLGRDNAEYMIFEMDMISNLPKSVKNLVVGTHFGCAPNPRTNELYPTIGPYFSPPLNSRLIEKVLDFHDSRGGQLLWCYGHSHINEDFNCSYGGRVVTNQMGYFKDSVANGITNPFYFKCVL